MALKEDVITMLRQKPVLGEYGAFNRPYVVLDVDEYRQILKVLETRRNSRKVPSEAIRA